MTTFDKLDQALANRGWRYDPESEFFYDGERMVPWEELLELLPGITLDELASYEGAKAAAYVRELQRRKPK